MNEMNEYGARVLRSAALELITISRNMRKNPAGRSTALECESSLSLLNHDGFTTGSPLQSEKRRQLSSPSALTAVSKQIEHLITAGDLRAYLKAKASFRTPKRCFAPQVQLLSKPTCFLEGVPQ